VETGLETERNTGSSLYISQGSPFPVNDQNYEYAESAHSKFPWGCLIGGCLTVIVLMLGGVVATGLAGVWFYKTQVNKYTSPEPRSIPQVEVSEEEIAAIKEKIETFHDRIEKGEQAEQLILTADDINALISGDKNLKGRVFVKIGEGQISAEVSIPTDEIPGAGGRFFNGSVTADAELSNGVLIVTVADAEVNGISVPEEIMSGIRDENLAKDLYKDPDVAKSLAKFESLVIENDRIILTPKPAESLPESVPQPEESPGDSEAEAAPSPVALE
jgi:hypothetical protein